MEEFKRKIRTEGLLEIEKAMLPRLGIGEQDFPINIGARVAGAQILWLKPSTQPFTSLLACYVFCIWSTTMSGV